MKPRLSVIIPVYGVERFVGHCTRSLMTQTLEAGVEFIFVDDKSPDGSISIIEQVVSEYPQRAGQVIILRHDSNKGLPAARNTGLSVAQGKYIYHFDGDDFAEPDLLEKMLTEAMWTGADYVWADWLLTYEHTDRLMRQPSYATPAEALEGILKGRMKYNVWNKLVRKSLYDENGIRFPEGYGMGEDMTMIRLLACASKIAHVDYAGYHYVRVNSRSMTLNMSDKSISDVIHNAEETANFLRTRNIENIDALIGIFCLHIKFPLLISLDKGNYKLWSTWWPESNSYIPMADFSFRSRLINMWAARGRWKLVKFHFSIYNMVYGFLFR